MVQRVQVVDTVIVMVIVMVTATVITMDIIMVTTMGINYVVWKEKIIG